MPDTQVLGPIMVMAMVPLPYHPSPNMTSPLAHLILHPSVVTPTLHVVLALALR